MSFSEMINYYNKTTAAHKYIIGFARNGKVYYMFVSWAQLVKLLKMDHMSSKRGGWMKAKIYIPAMMQKEAIASGKAIVLCDIADLSKNTKYKNNGVNFERIITETLTTMVWYKDSIPYYVQGDIELNGEQVQVKFQGAELTTELCIKNTMKVLGA